MISIVLIGWERNDKLAREIIALTMLGKVGTSVSNLDALYKRWRFKKGEAE